jgi:two-component system, OmpR family, phosphate regulon sensor histidine kinase PhoR
VDMKQIAHRAMHTIQPQAAEKSISLHQRLSDTALMVEGDGDMLYQVMLNLLSNAVKYTPEGGRVTVAVDGEGMGDLATWRAGDLALESARAAVGARSSANTKANRQPTSDSRPRSSASWYAPSVVVSVTDTGLGVPPESLPKLFDKFYRIENYKRVAKGTGLGLNLCKHIVETVHHGQIGVDSKVGMGSKFWFSIPMRYAGKKAA